MKRNNKGRFISEDDYHSPLKYFVVLTFIGLTYPFAWSHLHAEVSYLRPQDDLRASKLEIRDTIAPAEYAHYIHEKSKAAGVSARWIENLIACESQWDEDIQSRIIKNGKRENSWGLVQIFLDVNDITKAQAIDPYFAIDFAIEETAKGNAEWRWKNCYKKYRNKYPI